MGAAPMEMLAAGSERSAGDALAAWAEGVAGWDCCPAAAISPLATATVNNKSAEPVMVRNKLAMVLS